MIVEALAFTAGAGAVIAFGEVAGAGLGRRAGADRLALLGRLARGLTPRRPLPLADVERRLVEAGRPAGLGARDFLAAKLAGGVTGAGFGLLAGSVAYGRLALLIAAAGPAIGFAAPDVWLARRRRERFAAVRRDLPPLLDLLSVTVAAGASLPAALAGVGSRSRAPLSRRWAAIAAQTAVGVPLADALAAHRGELPIPEIESFVAALTRAARHGAPLADTLAHQAREARLARRRAVQVEAARAGPKMQLVVALLLVPSVMLLVAAALVSALAADAGELLSGY